MKDIKPSTVRCGGREEIILLSFFIIIVSVGYSRGVLG